MRNSLGSAVVDRRGHVAVSSDWPESNPALANDPGRDPRSDHRVAAADRQGLAGDVRGAVGGQEQNRRDDVFWRAEAAQRIALGGLLASLGSENRGLLDGPHRAFA